MNSKELTDLLNKDFGKDTVLTTVIKDIDVIPTGCIALDNALGVGGIPTQRITEFSGSEGSSKTTMALHVVGSCQAAGKIAVYVDAEHALDLEYAQKLGVDTDKMIVIQPSDAETALNIVVSLFTKYKDNLGLVVIDSIAALIPKAERDSDVGDTLVGLQARLLSSFIRRMQPLLTQSTAALLVINPQRATIGGMPSFGGQTKTTTGGFALRYACSVRVEFARTGNIDAGKDDVSGIKVQATIKKNKVAPPYKKAMYEIYFGMGASMTMQIMNQATELGIVKKGGSWYSYKDIKGQGLQKFIEALNVSGLITEVFDSVAKSLQLPEQTAILYKNKLESEISHGEISNSD